MPSSTSTTIDDTTSTPALAPRVNRRDVVMLPQQNDSWEVTEIISVLNPGAQAIVGQGGMPSMEIALPEGAVDFQAGEGDVLPAPPMLTRAALMLPTAESDCNSASV